MWGKGICFGGKGGGGEIHPLSIRYIVSAVLTNILRFDASYRGFEEAQLFLPGSSDMLSASEGRG